jgi:hypothetical protein
MRVVCKKDLYIILLCACLLGIQVAFAATMLTDSVSIVYNFHVAETIKRNGIGDEVEHLTKAALTLFEQYRIKYTQETQNYDGGLLTALHVSKPFHIRIEAAVAHVRAQNLDLHFSKIQTDDILFYAGYTHEHKRVKTTLSGVFGAPTHKDTSIINPQFGIGQVGLGVQLSSIFHYSPENPLHTFHLAGRLVHFFPRRNKIDVGTFNFSAGNLLDLLVAFNFSSLKHAFEIGYNPVFDTNVTVSPNFDDVVAKNEYIRHHFFISYKYRFYLGEHASALTIASSYGFDGVPITFGNKHIVTGWVSWSYTF